MRYFLIDLLSKALLLATAGIFLLNMTERNLVFLIMSYTLRKVEVHLIKSAILDKHRAILERLKNYEAK